MLPYDLRNVAYKLFLEPDNYLVFELTVHLHIPFLQQLYQTGRHIFSFLFLFPLDTKVSGYT